MDIYGDVEAMHGDSSAMSEKQDRLQAMVQQLGSMLQHAATGMQGRGQVALQRAGEDLQSYGTQQATMQGDHAEKIAGQGVIDLTQHGVFSFGPSTAQVVRHLLIKQRLYVIITLCTQ